MAIAELPTGTHDGASSSSSSLPRVGDLVAERYRLTRVIGAGGMGTVYEAESVSTGRRCAIKFLGSGQGGGSRSSARFEREAQTLARLEHEHVIAVFDFGWFEDQTPFFVMEYVRGRTLRRALEQDGPLEPERAVALLKQACRGMAHAHAQGVVHRDLKPDNLMLTEYADGRPWLKILDFGVARQLEGERIQLTPTGAELGTPHYMSPEQARGESMVDARADVYALGAILYEALSGQHVHAGASYNEVLFQVITQPHVPIAEVLPGCPSRLSTLVERCLGKDPAERPCHAGDLLSLLEQLQLSAPEVQLSHSAVVSGGARARWRRWSWPTLSIGLAVLLLALGRRGVEAPRTSTVIAPCSALDRQSSAAGLLASAAAPAPAPEPPALTDPAARTDLALPHGTASQSTPARRPRSRTSRVPPSAAPSSPVPSSAVSPSPVQASSGAAAPPPAAAPRLNPSGPDLPFATTNPYERP